MKKVPEHHTPGPLLHVDVWNRQHGQSGKKLVTNPLHFSES